MSSESSLRYFPHLPRVWKISQPSALLKYLVMLRCSIHLLSSVTTYKRRLCGGGADKHQNPPPKNKKKALSRPHLCTPICTRQVKYESVRIYICVPQFVSHSSIQSVHDVIPSHGSFKSKEGTGTCYDSSCESYIKY